MIQSDVQYSYLFLVIRNDTTNKIWVCIHKYFHQFRELFLGKESKRERKLKQ